MFEAARMGDSIRLQTLLNSGIPPNIKDWEQRTPLHDAAVIGNVKCVTALLHAGAFVNVLDVWGNTPLYDLVYNSYFDCTDPQIYTADDDEPILLQRLRCMDVMFSYGADPNMTKFIDNNTAPLHEAVECNQIEYVDRLLLANADPNKIDGRGRAPLQVALRYGNTMCVNRLLDSGASYHGIKASQSI